MISWIVASHDERVLADNLGATWSGRPGDELIVLWNRDSITQAYAEGQAQATQPIRCYVHHDVRILHLDRLRDKLDRTVRASHVGMVGVIGSRDRRIPWWDGDKLGSVVDGRMGRLDFGPGGDCSILDGLLLATRHTVDWDTDAPGWHGYDHDACAQMLHRGLSNWCLTGGADLLLHNTIGPSNVNHLNGWDEAVERYRTRWETPAVPAHT